MSFLKSLFGSKPDPVAALKPGGRTFPVTRGETILESALKAGIGYPHDCTVGTCGSCRSRLLAGRIEAITPFGYTLSKDELDAGYILACQALAKSDLEIEIEVDSGETQGPTRQAATLVRIDDLTHDIKRLVWSVEQPLTWRAGQYANLYWQPDGPHRSYSFANAPSRGGALELETFVRHVPGGLFTDHVFTGNPHALTCEIDGPHGNFWLREGQGPIICVAGGSGLAPILSLLSDAAARKVRRDCVLLFGARTEADLYALEEIAAVRSSWTAGFDFWPVLSEQASAQFMTGMVTEHIPAALNKLGGGAQAYMCGPPPMIDAAIAKLTALGIQIADIHYDKFTDASSRG